MQLLKKVGAIAGSALLLGSTLGGAALAQDTVDKFYSNICVKDGEVGCLFVLGSQGVSASGLIQDMISAGGPMMMVGQKAIKSAAGTGEVVLAVESETVDGREIKTELGQAADVDVGDSITLRAPEKGGINTLKTLKSGTISMGGNTYDYEEKISISNLDNILITHAADHTVTSPNTAGYDKTVVTATPTGEWFTYTLSFLTSGGIPLTGDDGLIKTGTPIVFMGQEYTIMPGSTLSKIKLTKASEEVTLQVGDVKEFKTSTGTYKIEMTLGGDQSAVFEITKPDGTKVTKSIKNGADENIGDINIYVLTTQGAYGANIQTAVASILISSVADILEIENDAEYPGHEDWEVTITEENGNLKSITVSTTKTYTGLDAWEVGEGMAMPTDLVKITYSGMDTPNTIELKLTPGKKDIDKGGDVNEPEDEAVVVATLPYARFKVGHDYTDTVYLVMDRGTTAGNVDTNKVIFYRDPSVQTTAYKAVDGTSVAIEVGDVDFILTNKYDPAALSPTPDIILTEPKLKYANEAKNFTFEVKTGVPTIQFDDRDTTDNDYTLVEYDGDEILWLENNDPKARTGYISNYGTVVTSISKSQAKINMPVEQAYARILIGSKTVTEETVSGNVGDKVSVGGVDITIKEAGGAGYTPSGIPMPVAKIDTEVTDADKQGKNLVLVGGPLVNLLTAELSDKLKAMNAEISNTVPGPGKGRVVVVKDAFASGKVAVVVAGSDRQGTAAAAQLLQKLDSFIDSVAGKSAVEVQYVGAGAVPTIVG
jgi:hypothetical protein